MGVSEGKALGNWLGPNTIAQVLKKLAIYDDWSYLSIHVAMDGCLISDDVRTIAAHEVFFLKIFLQFFYFSYVFMNIFI